MTTNNSINSNIPIQSSLGGTGVINNSNITLGGNFQIIGGFSTTFTMTNTTNVTLPTSGTLTNTTNTVSDLAGTANNITSSGMPGNIYNLYLPNNIYIGQSGISGTLTIYPSTASKGKVIFQASDNSGDTITTFTNASQSAGRTYTIPDSGTNASFGMTKGNETYAGVKTFSSAPKFSAPGFSIISGYNECSYQDTSFTTSQLKNLATTPVTCVSAPGAGFAVIPLGMLMHLTAGTAFSGGASTLMRLRYTDGSGQIATGGVAWDGFFNSSSDQVRWVYTQIGDTSSTASSFTPADNAPLVFRGINNTGGGARTMNVRVFYKVIPTTL